MATFSCTRPSTSSQPRPLFLNQVRNCCLNRQLALVSCKTLPFCPGLSSLNGFVGATLNANALATPSSPPSCSSSINSSPNSTGGGSGNGGVKIVRDERRRANHNEVERRRRDNINKWIVELSKVIPDCSNDQSKHGQVSFQHSAYFVASPLYVNPFRTLFKL